MGSRTTAASEKQTRHSHSDTAARADKSDGRTRPPEFRSATAPTDSIATTCAKAAAESAYQASQQYAQGRVEVALIGEGVLHNDRCFAFFADADHRDWHTDQFADSIYIAAYAQGQFFQRARIRRTLAPSGH